MRGRLNFRLIWPLTFLALSALTVLVLSLVIGAGQVDESVRTHEERMVRRGIDAQIEGDAKAFAGQTVGEAAVANLAERFNPDWARTHLPLYLRQSIGIWDYLVVDPADRPVWASQDAAPAPPQALAQFGREARPILNEIRDRERTRAAQLNGRPRSGELKPLVITRIEPRGGRAYMWMASVVQPGGAEDPHWTPRSSVVVAGGFVGRSDLEAVERRFALKDVRNETDPRHIKPYEARTTFEWPWSPGAVSMVWTPQRPGHDLLARSFWIIIGLILSFAALAGLMVMMTRRAAHELIALHRAQAQFLANMSHEIRTPLNGVIALAVLLSRSPLNPRQKQMADTIHQSGSVLQKLLTDILDLARIDAQGMTLTAAPFNLAAAVRSVVVLMSAYAAEQGLELLEDIDPQADTMVTGDATRLTQILTNLMSNAIKFTAHGHVKVSVRPVAQDPDSWRFEVSDTGMGFGPDVKARLFERFQQGDGGVTRRFGGAGLGLAISRELAGRMGGSIVGEGELERGAVFTLIVPLVRAEAVALEEPISTEAPPRPPPDPAKASRLRVLACEDDPMTRMVFGILLSELGVDFQFAENGQEACDAFEDQQFDCILMDMQMPVMDGVTAIRRIRERERERRAPRTPIIILTANALPEHRAAGMAAGADRFLVKPVEADELAAALAALDPMGAASEG